MAFGQQKAPKENPRVLYFCVEGGILSKPLKGSPRQSVVAIAPRVPQEATSNSHTKTKRVRHIQCLTRFGVEGGI